MTNELRSDLERSSHSSEMLLSRKVRISIFFKIFFSLAHSVIFLTASNSPFETLA